MCRHGSRDIPEHSRNEETTSMVDVAKVRGPRGHPAARQIGRDLSEVMQPRLAFAQVTLEPAHRGPLELRRSALGVEVDEL
jgi:hypothetical protein